MAILILAAGKGKRMENPEMAKVMYDISDKPMIEHVVLLTAKLRPQRTLLIVGWQKEAVIDYVSGRHPDVKFVEQPQQLGTGHAVLQARNELSDFDGDILVLSGDVPLLTEETVEALVGYHRSSEAAATILSAEFEDPSGYGRVVRNEDGSVKRIVEDKDATKEERAIKEINSGIYVFDRRKMFECIELLKPDNAQKEYYLTDIFESFWKNSWRVSAVKALDPIEVIGINTAEQLERARAVVASRSRP